MTSSCRDSRPGSLGRGNGREARLQRLAAILVGLLVLVVSQVAAAPQEPPPEEPAEEGETLEAPAVDDIDEMLQGEEEIFGAFEKYAYDPGERRDPFRSLLVTREATEIQGPRPEGIPGLLIDEVNLIGIIRTPAGYIAQVQAADRQKSYLLHEGEELFDGEVVSIESNEVVFKQVVRDPTAVKPFRERVKVLNPS